MSLGIIITISLVCWPLLHLFMHKLNSALYSEYYKFRKRGKHISEPVFCKFFDRFQLPIGIITFSSCLALIFWLTIMFAVHMDSISFVKKFESIKIDYEVRKETFSEIERAAMFTNVANINATLAQKQYWNSTTSGIFDLFYTDEIEKLKPIR